MPNPWLKPLSSLVGEWKTTGAHPAMPGVVLCGRVVFEWIEGGAFLKMSSSIDHPDFPDGQAIFGSDDSSRKIYILYFDERGVSRKYNFSINGNRWKWWRSDPEFSQRFKVTIEKGGNTMTGKGEMRKGKSDWEKDLDLTYTRLETK